MLKRVMRSLAYESVRYYPYNENERPPSPDEVAPDSVVLSDDVISSKGQDNILRYLDMG